jgi:purine-binding chemotaxis protein CheW
MSGLVRSDATSTELQRAAEASKRVEYLAFRLAEDTYAFRIARVAEILKPGPITPIPRARPAVRGIMSVRGRIVTVVDLRRRLRLAEEPMGRRTRVLLADLGDEQVGAWVDEVLQVYRLSEEEIEPPTALGGDQAPHVLGVARPRRPDEDVRDWERAPPLVLLDLRATLLG